jgi:hypothetical protein
MRRLMEKQLLKNLVELSKKYKSTSYRPVLRSLAGAARNRIIFVAGARAGEGPHQNVSVKNYAQYKPTNLGQSQSRIIFPPGAEAVPSL